MNQKIAYLGMGIMGSAMAANLARSNCPITVWNRTPNTVGVRLATDAGAKLARSVEEASADAAVIFTCLSDVAAAREVIIGPQGISQFASPNSLVVDMSTIGPACAIELALALKQKHLRFLDAPVTGGDIGARNGTLTIMVGGEEPDFLECRPLLEKMGKVIRLCGPCGSGQTLKLCNQILCAVNMISVCEAFKLAEQLGLEQSLVVDVCGTGGGGSWALSNLGPRILNSDLKPGFILNHMLKDLGFVREVTDANTDGFPGMKLAEQLFRQVQAMDGGAGGAQGTQAMIRAYEPLKPD